MVPKAYFEKLAAAKDSTQELGKIIKSLPAPNYNLLQYLVEFFCLLASKQDVNLMTEKNISIVFGPCLVRINAEEQMNQVVKETMMTNDIVMSLILNYNYIFSNDTKDLTESLEVGKVVTSSVESPISVQIITPLSPTQMQDDETESSSM